MLLCPLAHGYSFILILIEPGSKKIFDLNLFYLGNFQFSQLIKSSMGGNQFLPAPENLPAPLPLLRTDYDQYSGLKK